MAYVVITFFVLMAVGANLYVAGGIASSCEVETHSFSAQITCKFQIDLSQFENEFLIDHISHTDSGNKQETILQCQKLGGEVSYQVRNGYKLLKSANNTVIVQITEVTQEHAGQYFCAVIPSDPSEIKKCYLSPAVIASSTSPPTDPHNEALNDNILIEEDPFTPDSSNLLGVVLGVCISLALFLGLLIVAFIVCRKRRKLKLKDQTRVSEALVTSTQTQQKKESSGTNLLNPA